MILDLYTDWLDIAQVPLFDTNEVTAGNFECMYKSSARLIQFFNQTWLLRYICPREVMLDNGYKFKIYPPPLIKYLSMKLICMKINNPQ